MNKMKAFSRRICAGIASVATLLAGMAFATTANAATTTYTSGEGSTDDFRAGALVSTVNPQLTVTKYLSMANGNAPTGSSQDQNNVQDSTPAKGVVFSLTEIEATGNNQPKDFTNTNGSLTNPAPAGAVWHPVEGANAFKAYGVTDANGVINGWQSGYDTTTHAVSGSAATIPQGHHYYVLHEEFSPYSSGYSTAEDSVFDLPYRATNTTTDDAGHTTSKVDGYVYHLHVFPKNVSNSPLHKTLTGSTGNKLFAQVGDVLTYDIAEKIYTNAEDSDHTNQKLSVGEMQSAYNDRVPVLKIADRLSSAFEPWDTQNDSSAVAGLNPDHATTNNGLFQNSYRVYLTYKQNGVRQTSTDAAPSRVSYGPNAHMMFGHDTGDQPQAPGDQGQYVNGNGTHYMNWYFFRNDSDYGTLLRTLSGSDISDIVLHITLHVKVTNLGDSVSNIDGRLTNDVASDVRNSTEPPTHDSSHTPSAGFQFGKTASDSVTPVTGAVFRLTQPGNSSMFLGSDGQFHTDNWYDDATLNPNHNVKPMTATSNNRGIVSFTGLPLLNSTRDGWNTAAETFDVYEYAAPDNNIDCVKDSSGACKTDAQGNTVYRHYVRATMPFQRISFSNVMNQNYSDYVASLNNDSRVLPDGWADMESGHTTNTDNYPLQFGKWSVDYPTYAAHRFTTITGESVYEAMRNFVKGERTPMQLPLTGGVGIVLLLLAGAAIITIVAIERKHRLAAARR